MKRPARATASDMMLQANAHYRNTHTKVYSIDSSDSQSDGYTGEHNVASAGIQLTIAGAFNLPEPNTPIVTKPQPSPHLKQLTLPEVLGICPQRQPTVTQPSPYPSMKQTTLFNVGFDRRRTQRDEANVSAPTNKRNRAMTADERRYVLDRRKELLGRDGPGHVTSMQMRSIVAEGIASNMLHVGTTINQLRYIIKTSL